MPSCCRSDAAWHGKFFAFIFLFSFLHLYNENKYYSDHVLYILHLLLHSIAVYRSLGVYIVCVEKKMRKKNETVDEKST